MRRVIYAGRMRLELQSGLLSEGTPRSAGEVLSFREEDAARRFVRMLAREPGVSASLRAFLDRDGSGPLSRRDDVDVLSELARRLHSGWIRVHREDLPPLAARDGEEELDAPVSVKRYEEREWKSAVRHEPPPRWKVTTRLEGPPIWKVTTTLRKPVHIPLDETSEGEP